MRVFELLRLWAKDLGRRLSLVRGAGARPGMVALNWFFCAW